MRFAAGCVAGALIGLASPLCADTLRPRREGAGGDPEVSPDARGRQPRRPGGSKAVASCGARGAGPKQASLEQCDLGLGPGRVEGAYAQLPRYFADTGKVQDVESRLVTCMMALQGFTFQEATRGWYKRDSDIEALVTYVAAQSKGRTIDVPAAHPAEAGMYEVGREIFWRRAGPLDFSCATCHSLDRAAHPPAGSAQLHRSARRALAPGDLARLPRFAEQRLDHGAAADRLLPANALARAGVPLRRRHRRRVVPAARKRAAGSCRRRASSAE